MAALTAAPAAALALVAWSGGVEAAQAPSFPVREYPVPAGTHPHDVAPARDGGVWYTAQRSGALGHLDPATGRTRHIPLGDGSAPHGVIVGPDGAPWITDGGLNAIVRVDPRTSAVRVFRLPARHRVREPEHGRLRPCRRALVHRPERDLRALEPPHGRDEGDPGAARSRPVRDHRGAGRLRLLRLARRAATSAASTGGRPERPCCSRRHAGRARAARGPTPAAASG